MDIHSSFITILKKQICEIDDNIGTINLPPEQLKRLYKLSASHDLAHIVGVALQNSFTEEQRTIKELFERAQLQASYRYVKLNYELEQICLAFEELQIPYMPLKGSVIRDFYPSPEMRTSCDIDIFIHNKDLEIAVKKLVSDLNYVCEQRGSHDVSLFSPSKVHLELHFDLIENNEAAAHVLDGVWETGVVAENFQCRYLMTNELFVVYHIAHMAEHFMTGGCGVRNFLDLWIIKNKMGYDDETVRQLLAECKLIDFGNAVIKLSNVWFSEDEHSDLTKEIEDYVFGAGIYGTMENKIAIAQSNKGGKMKYVLKRIFLPYSKLKRFYPRLERHPFLFPIYQVVRWLDFLFRKNKKRAFSELKWNNRLNVEKKERLHLMMEQLKLKA